jgi:SAM-dependent methyltransferase
MQHYTTVADFIGYWEAEGQAYVRRGDYEWMAALVPGKRVLEIGCGVGFATQALVRRGLAVLSIDSLGECLAATRQRLAGADVSLMQAEVMALTAEQRSAIEAFAPDTVVCWLMGAPAEVTGAVARPMPVRRSSPIARRFTGRWPNWRPTCLSVGHLHLVDRTVIPWQAKDIGRDTLVGYHNGKTLRRAAVCRRAPPRAVPQTRRQWARDGPD